MNPFVAIVCLGLLGLGTTTAHAQTARPAPAVALLPSGSLVAPDQGERPTAQTTPQNSSEPPVKAVPQTERKSKPQRVDENGEAVEAPDAPATARSARPERSARGSRASEGGRGARGAGGAGAGGGRATGAGRGRGH
ncbi:hypothetical protein [Hymenobacter antarcticus]|uniref:Translation initiation factor IF-2 n=1 Tax=Hymenobacter antarcticus TaxID=486270 RepID=A0ABP7PNK7_9BACT